MEIYNTTDTYKSIVHETWSLCDASITTYPLADVIRRINAAYEELVGLIINADGTLEFDDTNFTDLPRGTGTLVEGQQTYSFALDYLQITAIEIKNSEGKWYKLKPKDKEEYGEMSPDQFWGVDGSGNPNKGAPEVFDQLGDTLFLYPAPTSTAVTLTAGIRIWFKRKIDIFTTADTTQEPALPSTHHVMLAYMAAIPYCMGNKKDRVSWLEKKVGSSDRTSPVYGGMAKSLMAHYAHREKTKKKIMRPRKEMWV